MGSSSSAPRHCWRFLGLPSQVGLVLAGLAVDALTRTPTAIAGPSSDCVQINSDSAYYTFGYLTDPNFTNKSCTIGDKKLSIPATFSTFDVGDYGTNGNERLVFSFDPVTGQHQVVFDFAFDDLLDNDNDSGNPGTGVTVPTPPSASPPSPAAYSYTLEIVNSPNTFATFSTGSISAGTVSGSTTPGLVTGQTSLQVTNEFYGSSTVSITNTFSQATPIPGPLPALGLGPAFVASRRLRQRLRRGQALQ